ncbi:hypothetical protein PR003_g28297 [Phytophthora rubi]|uniref:Retrovirus-related Pol polyprotein from transposon TNT 1-94-like beta-barrel domain-containing protein n=1 Tax=Phytophthora rubi TaxID=129364 RepID=A0A6A4BWM1_9STRA|nr:hypothetical protein PR003_g28297 [Phytophthora rubi]
MAERYYNQQMEEWWEEQPMLEHAMQRLLHTEVCGRANNLVQDNIFHYTDPAMRVSMLSRLNIARTDYLWQAEGLAHPTQSTEIELRSKLMGRGVMNNVQYDQHDTRKCFKYDKDSKPEKRLWILDSGSNCHLVNDPNLLENAEEYDGGCVAADGVPLRIIKHGSVPIVATVMGRTTRVRLLDVLYASNLEGNTRTGEAAAAAGGVLMSVLAQNEEEVGQDVQRGPLMYLHRRLAHLHYDTILLMAKHPASGIALTDEVRANYLACTQGK